MAEEYFIIIFVFHSLNWINDISWFPIEYPEMEIWKLKCNILLIQLKNKVSICIFTIEQ